MRNFSSHLSYVLIATPEKYISKRIDTLCSSAWMVLKRSWDDETNEFQYTLKFHILTDVTDAPS